MNRLRIMEKEIDVDGSKVLYNKPFTPQSLEENWEAASGEWWLDGEWLTGKNPGNFGGMIYSRQGYPGNILMDFEGMTVPPCANDLNFTWNSQGWDREKKDAGISYIAGLEGWWEGKAGIERYPDCMVRAATPLFKFTPGQIYHIQAGSIEGHCFIFVDGKLVVEMFDPQPLDSAIYSKVGFGTYASYIKVRNLTIRQIKWMRTEMSYTPEFK